MRNNRHGIISRKDQEHIDLSLNSWYLDSSALLSCGRAGNYEVVGTLVLNPWRREPETGSIALPINITRIIGKLEINCKTKDQYLSLKNDPIFKNLTLGGEFIINAPVDFLDEIVFMKKFVGKLRIRPTFATIWTFKGLEDLVSARNIREDRQIKDIYINSYIFSELNKTLGKIKKDFVLTRGLYSLGDEHLDGDSLLYIIKEKADVKSALEHYEYMIKLGDTAGARNLAKLFTTAGKNIFFSNKEPITDKEKTIKIVSDLWNDGIDIF